MPIRKIERGKEFLLTNFSNLIRKLKRRASDVLKSWKTQPVIPIREIRKRKSFLVYKLEKSDT